MSRPTWFRHTAFAALSLLGALVVILAAVAAWIANADLASVAARVAGDALERRVSIGSLGFGWQGGLTLELRDLRVANASWSATPDMAVVGETSAVIDATALLRGVLRYDRLRVRGVRVALERDAAGTGNWEFGKAPADTSGGLGLIPKERTQFPTLIDALLQEIEVTYRTSSGAVLDLDLGQVTIETPGDDRPVSITAAGAYNGVAARLSGTGASFDAFRNDPLPYDLAFSVETPRTTARFDGTLTNPLDFDGAVASLAIDTSDTTELTDMLRAELGVSFPVRIAGAMTREGDDWRLAEAAGAVAGSAFTGSLQLAEGGRGAPDDVTADLDFAELDIAKLLGNGGGAAGSYGAMPLALGEAPGVNLDARLRAADVIYGKIRLADATLAGRMEGRRIAVDEIGFALAGGKATAFGSAEPAGTGGTVSAEAALIGIDAAEVAAMIGAAPGEVSGRVDGRATLEMTGKTVKEALGTSRGHAVVAMNEGRIARAILEKAASDLRALFRSQEGTARIHCVLGILDLTDGVGRVKLLKLRTAEATLNGGGTVNLVDERIDMTFMTAPDSTGFFALDVPFRVRGSLANPSIEPQLGGGPTPGEFPVAAPRGGELPAALNALVQGNACRG